MARLLFTQAARADLADAVRWYDTHAPHVVPQFRDALRAALNRVAENPKQFPPTSKNTRRALLRRFPYILVFRETQDAVYVVAVFHTSRDPLIWKRRS
ncbi:type II toxin-antitoxin system RelE/ParE family toxin [Bradyrhizobium sp. KB893862 SZCCT0404]|uniref:type II toxin-antitoxin system RelE/ParE family toxin n=1 Tax=Bradyrhizobium sp. KB893862 SZCCT0404 TaxID=2807672 RepID=UPI001BAE2B1B|nr:type II toxin-antitoxin system RelE/ParE family toxin [Bradyrhizobium sp. KB893862 SZCCT0404]